MDAELQRKLESRREFNALGELQFTSEEFRAKDRPVETADASGQSVKDTSFRSGWNQPPSKEKRVETFVACGQSMKVGTAFRSGWNQPPSFPELMRDITPKNSKSNTPVDQRSPSQDIQPEAKMAEGVLAEWKGREQNELFKLRDEIRKLQTVNQELALEKWKHLDVIRNNRAEIDMLSTELDDCRGKILQLEDSDKRAQEHEEKEELLRQKEVLQEIQATLSCKVHQLESLQSVREQELVEAHASAKIWRHQVEDISLKYDGELEANATLRQETVDMAHKIEALEDELRSRTLEKKQALQDLENLPPGQTALSQSVLAREAESAMRVALEEEYQQSLREISRAHERSLSKQRADHRSEMQRFQSAKCAEDAVAERRAENAERALLTAHAEVEELKAQAAEQQRILEEKNEEIRVLMQKETAPRSEDLLAKLVADKTKQLSQKQKELQSVQAELHLLQMRPYKCSVCGSTPEEIRSSAVRPTPEKPLERRRSVQDMHIGYYITKEYRTIGGQIIEDRTPGTTYPIAYDNYRNSLQPIQCVPAYKPAACASYVQAVASTTVASYNPASVVPMPIVGSATVVLPPTYTHGPASVVPSVCFPCPRSPTVA